MKTVLVTGATGVVGSAVVPLLLAEPQTAVRLIVRARSRQELEERIEGLWSFWGVDHDHPWRARLQAFAGDVGQPSLGLEGGLYRALTDEMTHVIHAAGSVRLNESIDEARRTALDGARHIATFALACRRSGSSAKLEFVSTVGVAGRRPGVLAEQPLTEPRTFHNTYEAAKAEAEAYLLTEQAHGLRLTIHRPSMVVGDSRTGTVLRFQVFYYLSDFLTGKRTYGIVPDAPAFALDIIPVDYVARAIQLSAERRDTDGCVFHLCSGPGRAVRLTDFIEQIRTIYSAHGVQLPRVRFVSLSRLRALVDIAGTVSVGRSRRALRSLPHFLRYLEGQPRFASVHTEHFFRRLGLTVPPVPEYLSTVLGFYLRSKARSTAVA